METLEIWDRKEVQSYHDELWRLLKDIPDSVQNKVIELNAKFHNWIYEQGLSDADIITI